MKLLILAAALGPTAPSVSPPPVVVTTPPPPVTPAPPMKPGMIGPVPLGNPGNWVSTNDYPASALRAEEHGTTRFRLTIDVDGRVTDCNITESSGTALLDATTCIKITQRARFNPAKDADGNPAVGTYSNAVRWVIPEDIEPLPRLGSVTVAMLLSTEGALSQCRVTSATDGEARYYKLGPVPCDTIPFVQLFRIKGGGSAPKRVSVVMTTRARETGPDAEFGPSVNAKVGYDESYPLENGSGVRSSIVEPSGKHTNCRIVAVSGGMARLYRRGVSRCHPTIYLQPFHDAQGQPVRRQLLESVAITFQDAASKARLRHPVRRRK